MIITLPWPHRDLFPNRKGGRHWAGFQRAKESARMDGYMAAKEALGRTKASLNDREPVRITFHCPDRRKRDMDGLHGAIKHHLDGIAKALGVDDSIFRPVTLTDALDVGKRGFVTVEIGE